MAGWQGDCAWIATPGRPGVDEDLTQRAQYGAVGCGVEISHDQHRTLAVELRSGGELGQKRRLSEPVVAVRDAVFEAGDDDMQRAGRVVDAGRERYRRPAAMPRRQLLGPTCGDWPPTH